MIKSAFHIFILIIALQFVSLSLFAQANATSSKEIPIEKKRKTIHFADKTPVAGIELKNLGDSINSLSNEYLPSLSLDGNTMIFTRNVGGNEDFFIAKKDSLGKWFNAQNMGSPPNTNLPDGAAMLSADGHYLFYTRCDMRSPDGIIGGGCDLAFSFEQNGVWSSPQYFGFTINTTGYEGQPCLSSDNLDLYFVSDREGGYGKKDIWVSHFANNFWSEPENLGANVNTEKDETSPFIHADNETLYFSSDGQPTIGLTDLFVTRKNINATWRNPVNLGAPINTELHDGSIAISANGKIGYCASDRSDTKGGLDIYSFNLYPAIAPTPTLCLKGFVVDKFTKQHLKNVTIEIKQEGINDKIIEVKSNAGDGSYSQALSKGKKYLLSVFVAGYRPFYKKLNLISDTIGDIYLQNIRLREPGLRDTLHQTKIMFQQNTNKLESGSVKLLDSILKKWNSWHDDSARVTIFLKGAYYCCDSLTDTLYGYRVLKCQEQLNHIAKIFEKRKITCNWVMQEMEMVIYNDDRDLFDEVEIDVVEDY